MISYIIMTITWAEAIEKFYKICREKWIPFESEDTVTLTKVWIIKHEDATAVKWAPWPWIPKEKLYSLPHDTLVYLDWYWFQTAWFLRKYSVDYNKGTLCIVAVGHFKRSIEEL